MKTLIFCMALLLCKQSEPLLEWNQESQKWQYVRIGELPNVNQDIIFTRTKEYIALFYRSAKDVTQSAEKETMKIIVKGSFILEKVMYEGYLRHTLVIDVRDNKFRVKFDNFRLETNSYERNLEKDGIGGKTKIMKQAAQRSEDFVVGLTKYIQENASKKDDF